jgi:hypothetical protein
MHGGTRRARCVVGGAHLPRRRTHAIPLVLTVSGRFPQAVILQSEHVRASTTWEGIVKHPLGAAVAVTAITLAAGAVLAADLPLKDVAQTYAAQELLSKQIRVPILENNTWSARGQREPEAVIRPPSVVPRTDPRATLAAAATSPNARDNHVLEFLRWKEHHSAMR